MIGQGILKMISETDIHKHPSIAAVIPIFNRQYELQKLLNSLKIIDYDGRIRIVIIDDASTVDFSRIFDDFRRGHPLFDLSVIKMPENAGPAAARNAALKTIDTEYVWFLDSDTEIFQGGMLKKAIEIFKRNPDIKGIGEEVFIIDEMPFTQRFKWFPSYLHNIHFASFEDSPAGYRESIPTSNLIVEHKALNEVGPFDPALLLMDDVDLCFRLRRRGYKIYACKEVAVYHHASAEGRKNSVYDFYCDFKRLAKAHHLNRIRLLALHKKYRLLFLPILDIFSAALILFAQICNRYNLSNITCSKSADADKNGNRTRLLKYAGHHLRGIVGSYLYAYKILLDGKL